MVTINIYLIPDVVRGPTQERKVHSQKTVLAKQAVLLVYLPRAQFKAIIN